MKLTFLILMTSILNVVYSWLQVDQLDPSAALESAEITTWTSANDHSTPALTCETTLNVLGGQNIYTYQNSVYSNKDLKGHTQVQIKAIFYLIDFTANENLEIYLDNVLIDTLNLASATTDVTCNQGSTYKKITYTSTDIAHTSYQAEVKFVLENPTDGSSTAYWGFTTFQICTDADCNAFVDPACTGTQYYYNNACTEQTAIQTCYETLAGLNIYTAPTAKFEFGEYFFERGNEIVFALNVNFTAAYTHSDACSSNEFSFGTQKLGTGDPQANNDEWNLYPNGSADDNLQYFHFVISEKKFVDTYGCSKTVDSSAVTITYVCPVVFNIVANNTLTYQEKFNYQVVVPDVENLELQDLIFVNFEEISQSGTQGCCDNSLAIATSFQICTDENCNAFQTTSEANPYTHDMETAIYFLHSIDSLYYKDIYHLNVQVLNLGPIQPYLEDVDDSGRGRTIIKFVSGIAGKYMPITIISKLGENPTSGAVTNANGRRVLESVFEPVGDNYRVKNQIYIDFEEFPKDKNLQTQEELDEEQKQVASNDALIVGVVCSLGASVMVGVIGAVVYMKHIQQSAMYAQMLGNQSVNPGNNANNNQQQQPFSDEELNDRVNSEKNLQTDN